MEERKISRQRAWQLRQSAEGRCQKCGRKATTHNGKPHTLCREHRDDARKRSLEWYYRQKEAKTN